MRWISRFRQRLRSIFRRTRVEQELGEELQYHLQHLEDDFVAAGMSPQDARNAALREMGAIEPRKEECRDARGVALVDGLRQDLTYALRVLRKSPAFTATAILSLALGIGANTAIFSVWNGLLFSPLPGVSEPGQLVMLSDPTQSGSWTGRVDGVRAWLTYEEFEQLRDNARSFSGVMASQSGQSGWQVRVDGGGPEPASGRLVSGGFFEVLGVSPALGRLFTTVEDTGDAPYAIISHDYWLRRFAGDPRVLGRVLTIRKVSLTIIGVTPPGFIGETSGQRPDLWIPLRMQPVVIPGRDRLHDTPPQKSMWLHVFGRLKPGVTQAQAEAEANLIFRAGLESFYGTTAATEERRRQFLDQRLEIHPAARGASATRVDFSKSLTALMAAVGVLLLIACANLANLLSARGAARRGEIALRLSLGATRGRVIRQLVTESLTLAILGGAAALTVAMLLHGVLVRMIAEYDDRFHMVFSLDAEVVIFLTASTVAAALLFGVLPAVQATRTEAGAALQEQNRGSVATRGRLGAGRFLVSVQLALSLPLLVGAGLLVRTVYNLQRADLGFPHDRLLLVRVDLRDAGYEGERRAAILGELSGEIQRLPGVRATTYSGLGLFSGGESASTIRVEGYVAKDENDRESALERVGPDYFSTLGVPLTLGREIGVGDRAGAPAVCVINEAFARRYFEGRNPIGMRITPDSEDELPECRVVGVAKNARTYALRGDVRPRFYIPAHWKLSSMQSPTFIVRTSSDAAPVLVAVRKTIQRIDPTLPILSSVTMAEQLAPETAQDRVTAQLAIAFGAGALALAAIGLYGVLSYAIARRTGEIAIRIALGAQSNGVIALILRETLWLIAAGLVLGGGLAWATSRLVVSRLYGVAPQDPATIAAAAALLLLVALTAAWLPARRASRLDPIAALRL